jgi:hypothetical protein
VEEYAVTSVDAAFAGSRERFESIVAEFGSPEAGQLTHADLEDQITVLGRELMRSLLQDHLGLRAAREVRMPMVACADSVERHTVERGHERALASVFGEVRVTHAAPAATDYNSQPERVTPTEPHPNQSATALRLQF